jgi:glutamine synthetase
VFAGFTDLYGRLLGKRFDAGFFSDQVAEQGTHACDYLLTVDMEMEPIPGYEFSSWAKGYGDMLAAPDLSTLRVASWLDRTAMVLCDVVGEDGTLVPQAPRSMLKRQLEGVSARGFEAVGASEIEYYIFLDSYRDAAEKGYRDLRSAGWYNEDYHALQGAREEWFNGTVRRHLRDSGVPVEGSKGEASRGQHELNVRYSELLTMADRHVVYKQCLKEIADGMGVSVTFMAKPYEGEAGSSCHLHISLERDGANAFAGESDPFRWFLGGWLAHAPELMVFYAPTVNSYKRYQPGLFAPTRMAWARDNRTASFRVVGHGGATRIECRLPGADCNPYLAFAAALASGMDGIANETEPPPAFSGDTYLAEEMPEIPRTLRDATDLFESSDFVRDALGEAVVEHYTHFFRTEQAASERAVTDWERRRYFERI